MGGRRSCDHPRGQHARLLEEHVHQFPEHVVHGHLQFLDHARIAGDGQQQWSTAGASLTAALARRPARSSAGRVPGRGQAGRSSTAWRSPRRRDAQRDVLRRGQVADLVGEDRVHAVARGDPGHRGHVVVSEMAGSARLPTITGWTNSTATCWASVLAPPSAEDDQPATPVETHGHGVTACPTAPAWAARAAQACCGARTPAGRPDRVMTPPSGSDYIHVDRDVYFVAHPQRAEEP